MKPSEAAQLVGMLMAGFPGSRMTEATARLYERLLVDLDFEHTEAAVTRIICTLKFCPTVAEIRDMVAELVVGPKRSPLEAWGDVQMAIRRVGSYGTPKFEDPLTGECVRLLGWRNLCLGDAPEASDRARFCELYQDLQRKQRVADVTEPGRLLPGGSAPALPARVLELTGTASPTTSLNPRRARGPRRRHQSCPCAACSASSSESPAARSVGGVRSTILAAPRLTRHSPRRRPGTMRSSPS